MILCLNLNAAIDKTIAVPAFEINQIHRPGSVIASAGGKGCNVAPALHKLGEAPVVSGWVGGFAGRFIESELDREGIRTDFIHTGFESRTCTSILDPEKQTLTEIYELGEAIPSEKVDELRAHIRAIIGDYRAVILSGSLPPGVPADFYASVIRIAREANVLTFLDSSGNALRKGAQAAPFLIKPNESEAKCLVRGKPERSTESVRMAVEISTKYKTRVVLSMGAGGAIAAEGREVFVVPSPPVEAKSAVGSGDCMLAGLAHGFLQGLSFEQAVINGVAAGAANTLTIGAGRFGLDDFERLREEVQKSVRSRLQ
jgi:1-phosphofructokinase family hexose kinase